MLLCSHAADGTNQASSPQVGWRCAAQLKTCLLRLGLLLGSGGRLRCALRFKDLVGDEVLWVSLPETHTQPPHDLHTPKPGPNRVFNLKTLTGQIPKLLIPARSQRTESERV